MDKHRKLTRVLFYAVVILGSCAVGVLCSELELTGGKKTGAIVLWLLAILIGWMGVNFIWLKGIDKKAAAASVYLHTDPDRYIEEINAILGDKKSPALQNVRRINVGAAYIEKKDYEKAKEIYAEILPEKLILPQRAVYASNLAYTYFMTDEPDEAKAIMEKYRASTEPFRQADFLGGSLAILEIYAKIANGERKEAMNLLTEAEEKWTDAKYAEDYRRIRTMLE